MKRRRLSIGLHSFQGIGVLLQLPYCVNHVLGIFRKLSLDKLNSMKRNGFRASPADYRKEGRCEVWWGTRGRGMTTPMGWPGVAEAGRVMDSLGAQTQPPELQP